MRIKVYNANDEMTEMRKFSTVLYLFNIVFLICVVSVFAF